MTTMIQHYCRHYCYLVNNNWNTQSGIPS